MSKLGRRGSIGVEQGVDWVDQQPVRPTQLLHVVFLSGNVLVGWEINSLYWADQAGFTFIFVSGGKLRILDTSRTFLFAAAMEDAAPPIIACILTDLLKETAELTKSQKVLWTPAPGPKLQRTAFTFHHRILVGFLTNSLKSKSENFPLITSHVTADAPKNAPAAKMA